MPIISVGFTVQLHQRVLQRFRDRQTEVRGVLKHREALVREGKTGTSTPGRTAVADDMNVDGIYSTDEHQDQHLFLSAAPHITPVP